MSTTSPVGFADMLADLAVKTEPHFPEVAAYLHDDADGACRHAFDPFNVAMSLDILQRTAEVNGETQHLAEAAIAVRCALGNARDPEALARSLANARRILFGGV